MTAFSTHHIDYLEREFLEGEFSYDDSNESDVFKTMLRDQEFQFLRIDGLADFWGLDLAKRSSCQVLMKDLLTGLFGAGYPCAYLLQGNKKKVSLHLGVRGDLKILEQALKSAYPGISFSIDKTEKGKLLKEELRQFKHLGLICGTPTPKGSDDSLSQIDRLIRGFYGSEWAYLVLAFPLNEKEVSTLHHRLLNEKRIIIDAERSSSGNNPLAEQYSTSLEKFAEKVDQAKWEGMWHSHAFIFTEKEESFKQGKSQVQAIFGGGGTVPDGIRVLNMGENKEAKEAVLSLMPLTTPAPEAPGKFVYPFKYTSLINSSELRTFIHFPTEEMPGFFITDYACFHKASHFNEVGDSLCLGDVLDHCDRMNHSYEMSIEDLDKHGLIAGTTGSGKTNTIFHLIKQLKEKEIPWLVIEPAKTEYRKLLQSEFGEGLKVFTLGDDGVSPFRLNPFEIRPGVSVQTHIDHLKSVFNASFVMYAPMPHVLERCIHEIYEDRGWDLVSNTNYRGSCDEAQPTLTDLYNKVDEVVPGLGYEKKITMDVAAALKTRIDSLRIGGKGLMLDTKNSIAIQDILECPTILEIEQVGDDDEKAFVIGLLLTALYEYYTAQGLQEGKALSHVTIVEEAHRLFRNVSTAFDAEASNMKGKAVETFCNILSEIRAYGEGFLISEQIPVKLAPDIIKNTNLKVMHRVVAEDDRLCLGATMNLGADHQRRVTSLKAGEAVVYSGSDDGPLLIKVPYSKVSSDLHSRKEENDVIQSNMNTSKEAIPLPYKNCREFCKTSCSSKKSAAEIVEKLELREVFSRYVLSILDDASHLINEFPSLLQVIKKYSSAFNRENVNFLLCVILSGVNYYFDKRGQQYGWTYSDVERMGDLFFRIIEGTFFKGEKLAVPDGLSSELTSLLDKFIKSYKELCITEPFVFPGCDQVCSGGSCLYRYHVNTLLGDPRLDRNFTNTLSNYQGEDMWKKVGVICEVANRRTLANHRESSENNKPGLCFAIQKSETMPYVDAFLREKVVNSMVTYFSKSSQGRQEL